VRCGQGVTKRCRLSWLTYSALVNEVKCGGSGGVSGSGPMSTAVQRNPNRLLISNSIFILWVLLVRSSVLQLVEYACPDSVFFFYLFGALRLQGVMLSHLNMMAATCACVLQLGEYAPKRTDILFSFLPLAHTLER
jgi:hypothetical protein